MLQKKGESLNICVYFVKKKHQKNLNTTINHSKILQSKFYVDTYQNLVEKYA